MASGDTVLEFAALPVGANTSAQGLTGANPSAPVLKAIQRLTLGSSEIASTPSNGDYQLSGSIEMVMAVNPVAQGGSSNAVTLFDSAKTYKVTITEV